jgi:hypothetical protein
MDMCLYNNNNQNAQVGRKINKATVWTGKNVITPFPSQMGGKSFRPRQEPCVRHCTFLFLFQEKELEITTSGEENALVTLTMNRNDLL